MGRLSEALSPDFDGQTYVHARDHARLSGQLDLVRQILSDRQWHTLEEIAELVGGSVPGVSARIRDLRKSKFGSHEIDREYVSAGLWRYRLVA